MALEKLLLCVLALSAQESKPLRPARLNVMASESMFPSVNRADAIASIRVVVETVARNRGFQVQSTVEVASTTEQLTARLRAGLVDVLVIDTPHYLSLASMNLLELVASGSNQGRSAAYPYLLLTREGSASEPGDLRGKRIVVCSRTKSDLGLVWLDTLLTEHRLGVHSAFFESVTLTYRPSTCVLPLYFGKIDACVVDSESWDTVRELNPQLSKLKVVAKSEGLVEGVVAFAMQPHPYRQEIMDALLDLHRTAAGQQMTVLFRTGPLRRARKEDYEPVRNLLQRHSRLNKLTDAGAPATGRAGY